VDKVIVLKNNISFRLGLFTKLYLTLALASILLIWLVSIVSDYTENKQSVIAPEYRSILRNYAQEASKLINNNEMARLNEWTNALRKKENTWVAILKTEPHWLVGEIDKELFWGMTDLTIGRNVDYPIHLDFNYNPVMKLPISNTEYNLMIQLPQRMRPGAYWHIINTVIRLGFPIFLIAFICAVIYRHIINPLKIIQNATQQISQGNFDVVMDKKVINRSDELGDLSRSFDTMAKRIAILINRQRQLIQDISHELRTPITRIKLILDSETKNQTSHRVEQEVDGMQRLLEDTLTLSWLNNEKTQVVKESIDLTLLLDSICEDACFEFTRNDISLNIPNSCIIHNSNHRSVGQAFENIIRNAMKYTTAGTKITISMTLQEDLKGSKYVHIYICDQGDGVEDQYLEEIFEPFFQIDASRDKSKAGYGLGLALTKRQIEAVGGSIYAKNNTPSGLCFIVTLPYQ